MALPYTTLIQVEELEPEAGVKLAQAKLGVKTLPAPLADLIHRKGQGNPLFIEELVNSLLSLGTVKVEDGECQIMGDLDKLELPDTVQKVVLARIDRLPEAEKITLKVAAAIGRTFQRDLLEAVHPWVTPTTSLNAQLARLQAEDFTRQEAKESDLDFLFKHVITQEVAYETMLYSQRRELHATIGAALETRYAQNEGEIVDLLAYHYARSNQRDKALSYLNLAGQKALDGYANEAAIGYLNDALAVAEELELVKVQFDLLAGREQAYSRLGNRMAQLEDLAQMKQLALAEGDLSHQLETGNRRLQLAANLGDYQEAGQIAQETLALAQQSHRPLWAARTLVNLGITEWRQGDYGRARTAFQQALAINGAAHDVQLKATSFNYLGLIHTQMSDYEQSRRDYQQALELYRAVGDRGGEAGCANNLGLLEASLGRYHQAQSYYAQALSISHTIGDRLREGISLNTLGQVQIILGDYRQAQENLERSLTLRNTIGDRRGAAFCLHDLGALYLARGHAAEAVRCFHTACSLRRELGEIGNYVASLAALGRASLTGGDIILAYQSLRETIDHLQNGAGSGEYPLQDIWWIYTQVCRARGHELEARQALHQAYDLVSAQADLIHNPELRQSYLENVRANAAIISEMARINVEL
jgi:predicted ATPase